MKELVNYEMEFSIQSLDGDLFQVKISRYKAEKVWKLNHNPYIKYGLDVLKDEISKHTGIDTINQQLIADEILTIATSIIPLENQVITLIIKPSFTIRLVPSDCPRQIDVINWNSDCSWRCKYILCYLHCTTNIVQIEVIGQYRGYFKIASKNLPHDLLQDTNWTDSVPYIMNYITPKYVWLQCDKNGIKIERNICQ
jgi:hypothetical protein